FNIKERFSSTRYALLNDFVIALNPLEADHNVPIILTDSHPPLRLFKIFVKLLSIILTTSFGRNAATYSIKARSSIEKKTNNITKKSKKGNDDKRKKYANCADKPITSASLICVISNFTDL